MVMDTYWSRRRSVWSWMLWSCWRLPLCLSLCTCIVHGQTRRDRSGWASVPCTTRTPLITTRVGLSLSWNLWNRIFSFISLLFFGMIVMTIIMMKTVLKPHFKPDPVVGVTLQLLAQSFLLFAWFRKSHDNRRIYTNYYPSTINIGLCFSWIEFIRRDERAIHL